MSEPSDKTLWRRAGDLFDELVELDPDARAARLASLASDPVLRNAVDTLLTGDAMADALLPPPGFGVSAAAVASPEDPLGLIGETVSHFRVEAFVAAGGMGMVYRADDVQLHRPVALKFLTPLQGLSETGRERFLREARSAAGLDHPNLCPVHEVGESRAGPFLAMPWYAGETLRDRLTREGRLPVATALSIAAQIAAGLRHAHAAGIVHRDIKPANVMLLADGTAKLLDFGLAGLQSDAAASTAVFGTIGYMAPEQLRHEAVDARADLWALGIVLYEMLTGVRPFAHDGGVAVLLAVMQDAPARPSMHRPALDDRTEALVLALLQKAPEDRPPDADAVLRAIAALRSPGAAGTPRRTTRRLRVIGGAVVLALSAFGIARFLGRGPVAPETPDAARYRLVLADVTVTGLDAALGRPLADEVRRFFGNERGAVLLSRAQVDSALRRMRYQGPAIVAPDLARDIARREGADAVLLGEVTPLGNGFLAALRVRSAATGEDVVSVSTTVTNPESELLPALIRLADSVQRRLQVANRDRPVSLPPRKLTTRSLHALQLVSQVRLNAPAAPGQHMAMLREALALDSTLAYAWLVIGNMLSSPYRTMLQDSAYANMYRLRDSLTPFEQAQVLGIYLTRVAWDRPRALAAYDRFLAEDSTEFRVILNMVELLNGVREFERAEAQLHRYRRALAGADARATRLVIAKLGRGEIATADSIVTALEARADTAGQQRTMELRLRLSTAARQYDVAARFAGSDGERATIARVQGRLTDARRFDARSDSALVAFWRVNGVAADPVYTRPLREAREALWVRRQPTAALARLDELFTTHPIGRLVELQHRFDAVQGAALYAAAGRPGRARALLDTVLARSDSITRRALYPLHQQALGEIALAEGRIAEAMAHFRQGDLGADGLPTTSCGVCVLPQLARTAERAGWADSARIFWTQYATTVAVDRHLTDQWFLRHAYRRLQALHAQAGDAARSATYATLGAALWRRADPGLTP